MKKTTQDIMAKFEASVAMLKELLAQAEERDYADALRAEYAVEVATKLRMLLSSNRGDPLLRHARLMQKYLFTSFYMTPLTASANNMLFEPRLLELSADSNRAAWVPQKAKTQNPFYTFDAWWHEIVIDNKHQQASHISRQDVVTILANKEGGAHFVDSYEPEYWQTVFDSGVEYIDENGAHHPTVNNAFSETVFSIASEFLLAYQYYKDTLKNATVSVEETKGWVLRLTYKGKNHNTYRYCLVNDEIAKNTGWFFDCYQPAKYEAFKLPYKRIMAVTNSGVAQVIDCSQDARQLLYLRDKECNVTALLMQTPEGYCNIQTTVDLEATNKEVHPLDYWLDSISSSHPEIFQDCLRLQGISYEEVQS